MGATNRLESRTCPGTSPPTPNTPRSSNGPTVSSASTSGRSRPSTSTTSCRPKRWTGRYEPLKEDVRARGLWAAHLPPELGGQGYGQVKLGLMHEILGTSPIAPLAFGNRRRTPATPRSSRSPAPRSRRSAGSQPLLAGDLQLRVLDDRARTPPAPTRRCCATRAVRDGDEYVINGHKWFSSNASIADFLIVMAVTDPDARPHQRASMFIVPVDTPGREHPARRADDGAPAASTFGELGGHAEILYEDVPRPRREPARRRGRGLPHRPAPARPGPDPPLHALARPGPAGVRHAVRARAVRARPTAACWPRSRRSRTGSPTRAAEMQAARLMTLHAAWMMDTAGRGAPRARRSR